MEPTYQPEEVLDLFGALDLDGVCLLFQVIEYDKYLYAPYHIRMMGIVFKNRLNELTTEGELPSMNYGIPRWLMLVSN